MLIDCVRFGERVEYVAQGDKLRELQLPGELDNAHVENGSIDVLVGTVAAEQQRIGALEPLVARRAHQQARREPHGLVHARSLQEVAQREQAPLDNLRLQAALLQHLEALVDDVGDRLRVRMLRAVEELGDELVEQVVRRQEVAQHVRQQRGVEAGVARRRASLHLVQKARGDLEHAQQVRLQLRVSGQLEYLRIAAVAAAVRRCIIICKNRNNRIGKNGTKKLQTK